MLFCNICGSHSSATEGSSLCHLLNSYRRFVETYCLCVQCQAPYFNCLTLKMKAPVFFFETWEINTQRRSVSSQETVVFTYRAVPCRVLRENTKQVAQSLWDLKFQYGWPWSYCLLECDATQARGWVGKMALFKFNCWKIHNFISSFFKNDNYN